MGALQICTLQICTLLVCALLADPVGADQPWPRPPPAQRPGAVDLELMRRGEVLEEIIQQSEAGGAARVRALFRAEPRHIWDTLGDCAANFRFVRGLQECEVTEQTPEHAVTRQVARKYWLAPTLSYRFETRRQPHEWIQIRLLDGDLKAMQGSWRFDLLDGGPLVLVTHEIRVQPQMPAPRWLVRRTISNDLQDMLACLRRQADASLSPEGAIADQKRCPKAGQAD